MHAACCALHLSFCVYRISAGAPCWGVRVCHRGGGERGAAAARETLSRAAARAARASETAAQPERVLPLGAPACVRAEMRWVR